ncbi:hypothetical protein IAD21_05885 [Abditibacteriota bacterium]|nr:hypothetical protein IAD21_05885 [Abditibacteriota bacterium]
MSVAALAAGASFSGIAFAQSRPAMSASDLERNFVSPPPVARPWVYWFVMDGNFTREGITADMEAMQRSGIGGVIFMEVNVGIPRGPVQFMSPEWQQLFKHAVSEAERLGLQITLNGGPGWTGSGGPWVKPDQSMQTIVSAPQEVKGPQHFDAVLPRPQNRSSLTNYYKDVLVLAFPKPSGNASISNLPGKTFAERGSVTGIPDATSFFPSYSSYPTLPANQVVDARKVINISAKMGADGHLNWDVPPGEWTILRFGAVNNGHSTRPSPAPGLGMESDKFSKTALDAHLNDFIGPLLTTIGPRRISSDVGWNMLHIDSWEVGSQNWTPAMLAEFKQRRGYDAVPYLPTLSGRVVNSIETTERFLWDWRQTCQELVVENHVRHFDDWGRAHGFGLSIEPYDQTFASDLSLGAPAAVPMGEFWFYDNPETSYSVQEAASIGHTNGRAIVGAEAFTSGASEAWRAYPGSMKGLGDWALSAGINRFVIHRYQHQPSLDQRPGMTMGPYGVHWERTQTWWDLVPAYHRYLARSQFLLRQGLPVADVCYLLAEGAPQVFRAPTSATQGSPPERLGYSFDGCAPEIVLNRMSVKNGRLVLLDGTSYRVLVLPERDTITPALLRKVSLLVEAGATVIGPRPLKSPSLVGYPGSDAIVQQLSARLWGDCDGIKITEHRFGKGRVIWKRDEVEDLSRERPSPFTPSQWIWYPEGQPTESAPVATRYFRRTVTVDNPSQLISARIDLTVDNSFQLSLNGQPIGDGDDFHLPFSFDVTQKLKKGDNVFLVAAINGQRSPGDNTPNPAGFIANIRLKFRDGRTVAIPTDRQWQSAIEVNSANWNAAMQLGANTEGPWHQSATVTPEQYGNYAIVTNVLQQMKVPKDFESDGPVRYIHRQNEGTGIDLYFVANRDDRLITANCTFRVEGKSPELWDPQTGECRSLPEFSARNGRITVPLRFEPYQSWFIVFRQSKTRATGKNFPTLRPLGSVSGPWQVAFDPNWGAPAQITFPKLEDWSKRPEASIRYYSGKAIYTKSFIAPQMRPGAPVYLDLGTVDNLAQVRLNGRDLGTAWCAPWRVAVSGALHSGENQLEITVANLWPNRLIGDQNLPAEQRLTSTTWNPFKSTDPLLPSGLLGPVTLLQSEQR